MKKYLLGLLVFLVSLTSLSAQTFQPKPFNGVESKGIIYNKEFVIDFKLHTNGYSLGVELGKIKTYYKTNFIHFSFGEIKSPKEHRQSFDLPTLSGGKSSRSFIYGKQNNFFALRGGVGVKRYLTEKAKRKGIALGITYEAGASLGITKPYYLELKYPRDNNATVVIVSENYSPENESVFLDTDRIYGGSSFSKGLDEVSVIPGGHAKLGLHFDWGAVDEFIKAIEVGVMADVFLQKVPIMVQTDNINPENRPFFINLYLTLQLGKRR